MSNQISRRNLLKGSALLAASSALGFNGIFGFTTMAQAAAAGDDVTTIINVAVTAETFAVTHYYRALTTKTLTLNASEKTYFLAALEAEFDHIQFLKSNGATPLQTKFYFPTVTFKNTTTLGAVTSVAETVFVGAYLAATRRFAELGNSLLAATAAQVAAVEAQHLLFVRQLAGEKVPNNVALAAPIFFNVSEAVPVVEPLLTGKKAASGPLAIDFETSAYDYPGDDKVTALIGKGLLDSTVLGAAVQPFTAMKPAATATMAATAAQ